MTIIIEPNNIIEEAYQRIKSYIHLTPIIQSETLNEMMGAKIYFKIESLQKTGAFKVRCVLNHLLQLQEQNKLPSKVVAYSTGNHGIGLAYTAKLLNIKARIYLPKNTSLVKQQAAKYYGAEVIYTDTRQEAEELSKKDSNYGFYYLHPSDSDSSIAGAGTVCLEALRQLNSIPDAIFASCGGGGLLSGTYLAKEYLSPKTRLFGCEPETANDTYLSLMQKKIFRFTKSPRTIADGLKALSVSERTYSYLTKIDEMFLVSEHDICYWTAWLIHLLKVTCEPSCALNMSGVRQYLQNEKSLQKILIIISGGNIDPKLYKELWKKNYLSILPQI